MAKKDAVRRVARRPYWREADARVVVEAWRASGEGLADFCRQHRVRRERVARWAARLDTGQDVGFHPVRLLSESREASGHCLEVELPGGALVRLPAGFELGDLRRVLVALAERFGC